MAFVSRKTSQFTYFASQLGEFVWRGKDVLDFGGNIGNILRDPNATIDEERYWCIDVDHDAVQHGQESYPRAHWLWYNRFSFFFNPYGEPKVKLPAIEQRFDYIVAYSVFPNTLESDMLELVRDLRGLLKSNGSLAFTFIDPHHHSWPERYHGDNLRWRLEKVRVEENEDIDIAGVAEQARNARWCVLVNGQELYVETEQINYCEPERQKSCYVFHTEDYMRGLFPEATIKAPANNEMQHCCIVGP